MGEGGGASTPDNEGIVKQLAAARAEAWRASLELATLCERGASPRLLLAASKIARVAVAHLYEVASAIELLKRHH